ncbi:MAG: hypothetical protein R3315_07135 [Woeseiaceae bacterium]|nr:hypothetical protein [Woeseiaceae bacterium]
MISRKIAGLPLWAIVLDGLGTLLVVGGVLIMTGALPAGERDVGLALVIVGALLMAPLILAIVHKATNRK